MDHLNIKNLRKQRGLTQRKLAALLGVSRPSLTNYENGLRQIPVSLLPQLREALGCTWEELFDETKAD